MGVQFAKSSPDRCAGQEITVPLTEEEEENFLVQELVKCCHDVDAITALVADDSKSSEVIARLDRLRERLECLIDDTDREYR